MKGISGEVEGIKIRKCSRNIHVDIMNEYIKGISSEEEEIGIRKCRKRSRVNNKKLLQNQQISKRRLV